MEIDKLIKNLNSRNMNGYFVRDRNEAKEKALSLISREERITFGGSETLEQIGIFRELRNGTYNFIDRDSINSSPATRTYIMKGASSEGIFLTGTNAITEDGRLVNMDGRGNRVNAINYGPDKVIIVVGKNKIVKNLDEAIKRIETVASPPNSKRLNKKTPCVKTGKCMDCRSQDRICNILSIVQFQNNPDRIHVIIVNEDLGY